MPQTRAYPGCEPASCEDQTRMRTCGNKPALSGDNCPTCASELSRKEMMEIAVRGRVLANTPEANAKRVEKQAKQSEALGLETGIATGVADG